MAATVCPSSWNQVRPDLPLENVEHCGGEPEQADGGYYVTDVYIKSIVLLHAHAFTINFES